MEHSRTSRARNSAGYSPQIVVRVTLLLTCANLLATLATTTIARMEYAGQEPRSDLLAAYAHIMPGQRPDIAALEAEGFLCKNDTRPTPADLAELCSNVEGNQHVSAITISVWDAIVEHLDLKLREGSLTIGDLALLWGKPEIRETGHWISLLWRERHISALGWSYSGQFSYFQFVGRLSFEL